MAIMKLKSKIKKNIPEDLARDIAALCDTMRINSSQHKMVVIQQLLNKYNIKYSVIGGATNRLATLIDGYTVKFAIDNQGYVDNLIEYSICRELQPYVTKTYETNGYILVAEGVKPLSLSEFKVRRSDIEKVLSILAQDYLLGDVGYIPKNYTNWGVRDDGSVVILDYAYIHRGTEKLFTCEVCGCGILRYDATFSYLKCSNTTACNASFDYIDRKRIQGDQVDLDMVEEAKEESIKLTRGMTEKEVTDTDGKFVSGNKRITYSFNEYINYVKEKKCMMPELFDSESVMELMVEKTKTTDPERLKAIDTRLKELYDESAEEPEEELIYEDPYGNIDPDAMEDEEESEEEISSNDDDDVLDLALGMDDLVAIAKSEKKIDKVVTTADSKDVSEESEPESMSMADLVDIASGRKCLIPTKRDESQEEVEEKVEENESEPEEEPAEGPVEIDTEQLKKSMMEPNEEPQGVFLNGEKL